LDRLDRCTDDARIAFCGIDAHGILARVNSRFGLKQLVVVAGAVVYHAPSTHTG